MCVRRVRPPVDVRVAGGSERGRASVMLHVWLWALVVGVETVADHGEGRGDGHLYRCWAGLMLTGRKAALPKAYCWARSKGCGGQRGPGAEREGGQDRVVCAGYLKRWEHLTGRT